ncbi:MAG: hypothetical protein R6U89_04610 [Dehalococcoidia bacterium]
MNNLANALECFVHDEKTAWMLSQIMEYARKSGKIDYSRVEEIAGDNAEDIILTGWQWRLLIPVRTSRCGEWDDRVIMLEPGEEFEMPNIVCFLVDEAISSRKWNTHLAVEIYFQQSHERDWDKLPDLVMRIKEMCSNYTIDAPGISKACNAAGLKDRADTMIAILKGAGVISPKLGSLALVSEFGAPLYEFNPSVFAESTVGLHVSDSGTL